MKLKRYLGIFMAAVMAIGCFPLKVSYAAEYDMKYFRFAASESTQENNPANVKTDGKSWSTSENQKAGDYFIIDMYEKQDVGKIVLTQPENQYPFKYNVYVAGKKESFGEPVIQAGEGNKTNQLFINLPEVVNGRFIKIELIEGTEEVAQPWCIEDVKIYKANDASSKVKSAKAYFKPDKDRATLERELLSNIGVDISLYDGTRASFAKILTQLCKISVSKTIDGTLYADVDKNITYAAEAEAMYKIAENDIKFRPTDKITLDEALKWILNIMGYEDYANIYGGYPEGYRKMASGIELLEKMDIKFTEPLSEEDASTLLFNALSAQLIRTPKLGNNKEVYEVAMYHWHKVREVKGTLVSNGKTSRSGAPLVYKNHIMINEKVFYDKENLADEFVGMKVTAYVREGSDLSELIYIVPTEGKNKVLVIPGENIEGATAEYIKYRNDLDSDTKLRSESFDNNPDMIYNGRGNVVFDITKLTPQNGKVTLIDSDNSGRYDLVVVEEYINYFLGYKENISKTFSDIYGNPNIKLSEVGTEYDIFYKDKKISFEDIPDKCVISVAADKTKQENGRLIVDTQKSKLYTLYVSDTAVTGICDGTISDFDIVTIDGIEYKKSEEYSYACSKNIATELIISKNYRLYMDINNHIAAVEEISSTNEQYGLLLKTIFMEKNGEDYEFSLRLLTETGELITYPMPEKVKIDGRSTELSINVIKGLFWDDYKREVVDEESGEVKEVITNQLIPQVVGYKLNEANYITALDTKNYNPDKEDKYTTLYHIPKERYTTNVYRGMIYPTDNKSTAPNMNTKDAILFTGPGDISDADIENDYNVQGYLSFEQDGKYDMEVFKKSEYNDLQIAFIQSGVSSTTDSYNYILIDNIKLGVNRNDEVKTIIKGVNGDGVFEAFVYSDTVLQKAGVFENGQCTLERGDLIIAETNASGEIVSLEKLRDVDDKITTLYNNGKYYNTERITIGQVYKNNGNRIMVTSTKRVIEDGVEDGLELFMLPDNALVYDEENDEVRKATASDIRAYEKIHDDNKTSKVYICTTWGLNVSFVIYNYE